MTAAPLARLDGALALILGAALAWTLFGGHVINPFDTSWLTSDPGDSQVGWSFFRHEPAWHFPLLWSGALGYPLGVSTAYWDIIPPLALVFRLLAPVLPAEFQYFGLYAVLCCGLQSWFGLRWGRRLAPGAPLAATFAGLLFATAPPLVFRFYAGHFALASHWQILAALICLHDLQTGARVFPRFLGLCLLAAAINPYLLAMVLLIATVALATTREPGAIRLRRIAILAAGGLLMMIVVGFVILGDHAYAAGGYGQCSMNLLAPIDPAGFRAILLPRLPVMFDRQIEGYNYLGLGILALAAAALARRPALLRVALSDSAAASRMIVLVSLLLALSSYATIGGHVLYNAPLPKPVLQLLASFRSSGRLFWPGYYVLIGAVIAAGLRAFPGPVGTVILAAALALQLADTASLWTATRARWTAPVPPSPLHDPVWQALGRTSRHLVVLPAWQCDPIRDGAWVTPGGIDGYQIFGDLAVEQGMTLNSFYAPRLSDAQRRYFCHDQAAMIEHDGPAAATAYVFNPGEPLAVRLAAAPGMICNPRDGLILCRPR